VILECWAQFRRRDSAPTTAWPRPELRLYDEAMERLSRARRDGAACTRRGAGRGPVTHGRAGCPGDWTPARRHASQAHAPLPRRRRQPRRRSVGLSREGWKCRAYGVRGTVLERPDGSVGHRSFSTVHMKLAIRQAHRPSRDPLSRRRNARTFRRSRTRTRPTRPQWAPGSIPSVHSSIARHTRDRRSQGLQRTLRSARCASPAGPGVHRDAAEGERRALGQLNRPPVIGILERTASKACCMTARTAVRSSSCAAALPAVSASAISANLSPDGLHMLELPITRPGRGGQHIPSRSKGDFIAVPRTLSRARGRAAERQRAARSPDGPGESARVRAARRPCAAGGKCIVFIHTKTLDRSSCRVSPPSSVAGSTSRHRPSNSARPARAGARRSRARRGARCGSPKSSRKHRRRARSCWNRLATTRRPSPTERASTSP